MITLEYAFNFHITLFEPKRLRKALEKGRRITRGVRDRITNGGTLDPQTIKAKGMSAGKVDRLRKRYVRGLVERSQSSWGTTTYDWVQSVLNGYK